MQIRNTSKKKMNFTSEEFRDSDEVWLAENVFSQLKDFGPLIENNNAIGTQALFCQASKDLSCENNQNLNKTFQTIVPYQSLRKEESSIFYESENTDDAAGTILKNIKIESENINQESVQVNQFIISKDRIDQPKENLFKESTSNIIKSCSNSEMILIENKESQQYFEILMSLPEVSKTDEVVMENKFDVNFKNEESDFIKKSFTPKYKQKFVKCSNCHQMFKETSFVYHICDYDWTQTRIPFNIVYNTEPFPISSFLHPSNKHLKDRLIRENKAKLPHDHPCIRQLRENIGRLRKFIKDELKIDLVSSSEKKIDGPHECTLCERKFVHASGLARHMEKHAMDLIPSTNPNLNSESIQLKVMLKCFICGRLFFKTKDIFDHLLKDHQENEKFLIEQNNLNEILEKEEVTEEFINFLIQKENKKKIRIYEEKKNICEQYLDAIIVNDVLQCEFCEFIFSDCSHLLLHSAHHDPNSGFECISCEIKVPTSKEIFLHWQAECVFARELIRDNFIIKRYYTCNVCENKFCSVEQLTDHRYTALHFFPRRKRGNMSLLQIGCEYCGSIFETIEKLIRHREEKHLKKLIEKKGVNIVQSTDFGNSNQKTRQYLCDVCGKSYTQSSHLWQHLRFHRGVKPFACKEPNCNRSFTIRPDLNDHIRKCHTGERPYQCQVCGKRFLTGSVYYQHRLIHRGDRRYACEECGKRFYRADALKNHQRIHTGEKPYGCLYCTKNFRQRGDRDKHIRARHANLDENAKNVLTALKNGQIPPPPPPAHKQTFLAPMPLLSPSLSAEFGIKSKDVVFVGNVPFPSSMFTPILKDVDG